MAITFVASTTATPGANGGTTAAINTTGATLLVIGVSAYVGAGGTVTVSDSKGNTYTGTPAVVAAGQFAHRFFYALAPVVGTGHTFTATGTGIYPAILVHAFAGVAAYQFATGATGASVSSLATGALTPVSDGALLLTGDCGQATVTDTISSPAGFTLTSVPQVGGTNCQGGLAYAVQATAAAVNPTWGFSPAQSQAAVTLAVFLATTPTYAFGRVQATPKVTTVGDLTSVAVTFGTAPTVGHGVVMAVISHSSTAVTAVTDTAGNTYVLAKSQSETNLPDTVDLYVCAAITATATPFTVTATGVSTRRIAVAIEATLPLVVDQTAGTNGVGNTGGVGPTAAVAGPDSFVVAVVGQASAIVVVAGAFPAWTQEAEEVAASVRGEVDSRSVPGSAGSGQSAAWTFDGATFWVGAIVAFKAGTPALVTVPDVVGLTAAAADTTLVGAGFVTGTVTTAPSSTVAAGLVIAQSPAAGASAALGSAVDLVLSSGVGRWTLVIAGVDKTPIVDSLSITWALNERTRATAVLSDTIPDRYAEITSTTKDGGALLFGGLILSRAFAGRNQYDPDFQMTLDCGDWFAATDWVHATLAYAADVPLEAVLVDLVDGYLAQYGITLDAAQATGPTLAPFSWVSKRVSDAIRELTDRTGYVATMSPTKVLRMIFPGTLAAPFAITEDATHVQELSWRDHDQAGGGAVNTVRVIAGPTGAHDRGYERHYGDGVTRVWELDALFITEIGALHVFSEGAGGYPLATYGVDFWPDGQDYPWSQDPVTNTIRQRADQPVLAADDYWWLDGYIASYPMTITATCPEMSASPAPPVIEHVEIRTDVMSRPVAQEIADALIAQLGGCASSGGPPEVITFRTDEDGVEVGQAITVDLPTTRSIAGEFVVTSVALSIVLDPDADTEPYWLYTVEAQDSDLYQGSYLTGWRKLTGTGGDAAAGSGGGVASGGLGAVMQSPAYLGGSRGVSVSASPAAWLPVVNYVPFIAPASFLARVRVELFALNPGVTAQARLYNVTAAAAVASSSVVTSLTAVAVSFGADVEIGKAYRLEVIAGTAAEGVFAIGTIEAA